MDKKSIKSIFVEGAITPSFIATAIEKHQSKTGIGAHDIFMGQVRADVVNGNTVTAIEFTAQEEMANAVCHEIKEAAFAQFPITCMHIYHSLGTVKTGELCIFVFVSAPHRKIVFEALSHVVNQIKAKAPIFGKELFDNASHQWKTNT